MTYAIAYGLMILTMAVMIRCMYRDFLSEVHRLDHLIDCLTGKSAKQKVRETLSELDSLLNKDGCINRP